jgi:dCMP deaminase
MTGESNGRYYYEDVEYIDEFERTVSKNGISDHDKLEWKFLTRPAFDINSAVDYSHAHATDANWQLISKLFETLETTGKKKSKLYGINDSEIAKDWYPYDPGYIKPDWPTYFITLAFITAQRSIDPNTKHGCIAVDADNAILSTGYNGPPRGCNDEDVPKTRPDKYLIFTHAEENCIINAARKGISLDGSTFYITGYPCARCLGKLINAGVRKVVYSSVASACLDDADERIRKVCLGSKNAPEFVKFDNIDNLKRLVEQTERYIIDKLEK